MGDWDASKPARTAKEAVERISADLAAFIAAESLEHLIVLSVASTEPPFVLGPAHECWDALNAELTDGGPALLPAS